MPMIRARQVVKVLFARTLSFLPRYTEICTDEPVEIMSDTAKKMAISGHIMVMAASASCPMQCPTNIPSNTM